MVDLSRDTHSQALASARGKRLTSHSGDVYFQEKQAYLISKVRLSRPYFNIVMMGQLSVP
jgi:hypothetical protein